MFCTKTNAGGVTLKPFKMKYFLIRKKKVLNKIFQEYRLIYNTYFMK